jgi:type IV pilus assembly protein PilE
MRQARGFTLLELMIVVVVVAILAAIALPSYRDYILRGKITEATSSLSELRLRAEKWFADNRSYLNAGGTAVGFNTTIANSRYFAYSCPFASASATAFVCTATGVPGEGMDGFLYSINQSNTRVSTFSSPATGWTSCATKWIMKKGESC